jgi:predicted RNA-binding protein
MTSEKGGIMCESNVYIRKGDAEEKVLEDVEVLRPEADGVFFLANIYGEQKRIKAKLVSIDFTEHKVLLSED